MGPKKPLVREVNPYLICVLCSGYYIEAATIVECLHSFCRSCLVTYLETHRFCPKCDVQLNKHNPLLSIRCDTTLQQLVYKLVPGLYSMEMARRRDYYSKIACSPDVEVPIGDAYFSPDDSISLSLEFIGSKENEEQVVEASLFLEKLGVHRRYLQCPAAVNMSHLKKFLRMKYNLTPEHKVDIIYSGESLEDDFSLMDVAYTFNWNKTSPMRFKYRFFRRTKVKVTVPKQTFKGIVDKNGNNSLPKNLPIAPAARNGNLSSDDNKNLEKNIRMNNNVRVCVQKVHGPKEKDVSESEGKHEEKPREKIKKRLKELRKEPEIEPDEPVFKRQRLEKEKAPEHFDFQRKNFVEDLQDEDEDEDRLRISASEEDVPSESKMETQPSPEPVPVVPVRESSSRSEERRKEKKKSKKAKREHHHHHRHHDRKRESSPPAATILHSPENDIMKLKVKLTTVKTNNNSKVTKYAVVEDDRKEPKENHYSSRASQNNTETERKVPEKPEEVEKPVEKPTEEEKKKTDIVNNNKSDFVPKAVDSATKEKLLQTLRPKPLQNGLPAEPIKLPPSSITVSKITAEEKRQMEQQKLKDLNKGNEDESKRPSLEIMLVNAPSKPEPEQKPPSTEAPKKTIRPPPPSIPLSKLNKNLTRNLQFVNLAQSVSVNNPLPKLMPPMRHPKTSADEPKAKGDDSGVLDLSEKSSRKSPEMNGNARLQDVRNLMTLSDTAVQVRNMMAQESSSPTTLKIPIPSLSMNNKTAPYLTPVSKPRPNQNIRQIPNPSALTYRQHGRHLGPPPGLPLSSLRKMESMARTIDKLAAGLQVKAVEAAYGVK